MYKGERFNGVSHLIGSVMAAAGLVVLIVVSARQHDPMKILSMIIYGTILFLLYSFSTLYHSLRGRAKAVFRKIEHLMIYLLIAGTYTPITLITLKGSKGWVLFWVIWGLAVIGILQELFIKWNRRIIPVVIYILMGWAGVFLINPLAAALPGIGLAWIVIGGLFYTFGVILFALDKRVTHSHGAWHVFVMAGSTFHYFAILFYVA